MWIRAGRRAVLLGVGWAIQGCAPLDHRDYIVERAEAECKKYRACSTGYFESEYRDYDDCVDERSDAIDEMDDALPKACDYDADEGRRCVRRIQFMGCEEFAEQAATAACDLVWDCND